MTERHINIYLEDMETVSIKPERKAQLDEYAKRHGQDAAAALDQVLADYLEWEQRDYQQGVEGIREGFAGYRSGGARPSKEVFQELREKHGFPR